jgi:hypothetical protein
MGYQLEGRLLEVCDCDVLCPCWVGEDPDNGTCDSAQAWRIDSGSIDGVDVTGRTIAILAYIPGNVLKGNWKTVFFIDDGASDEQRQAIVDVWMGKRGGPVADLAQLFGEIIAVEQTPIMFEVDGGQGYLRIGDVTQAELSPFHGATGGTTVLQDTLFSTIPGSPAYVGKASLYRRMSSQYGLNDVNLNGSNAIQGHFRFAS